MTTNCRICKASLEINETGKVVFCPECDRTPDRRKESLGGLLDAIKEKKEALKDTMGADLLTKLWLARKKKEIDDTIIVSSIDEITIKFHCLKCKCPINGYGWCVECEDMLRETL